MLVSKIGMIAKGLQHLGLVHCDYALSFEVSSRAAANCIRPYPDVRLRIEIRHRRQHLKLDAVWSFAYWKA